LNIRNLANHSTALAGRQRDLFCNIQCGRLQLDQKSGGGEMRKYIFSFIVIAAIIMQLNCETNIPKQDYAIEVDPGSMAENCCGVTYNYEISGIAPAGGQYYWLGLISDDTLVQKGDSAYFAVGEYNNITLSIDVSHLDNIPSADYAVKAFACQVLDDVGNIGGSTMIGSAVPKYIISYEDSVCQICCTNVDNGGLKRYYARSIKDIGDLIGVQATIKTRLGSLCHDMTSVAQSGVWSGIQDRDIHRFP